MQRSFSFAIFSISVYLLFIVVDRVSADDCNPGFSSPGWMFPRGDVSVELGKNLTMFCGVNSTHPNGKNYSWKNLSFLIDNKTAATPWVVEKENETSIRLSLNQTTLAPDDYYRVSCTLNDMGICTRFVYVGYQPLEVTDFECTSYNWQRLECVWKEQPNPIKTTYTLSYQTPNSRRIRFICPSRQLDEKKTACNWTNESGPVYYATANTFNFTMFMSNALAPNDPPIQQYLGVVDNYAIVIPAKMEDINATALSSSLVLVTWDIPYNLQWFPPGLDYSVRYQIMANWTDSSLYHEVDTSQLNPKYANKQLKIDIQVPFPNTEYKVLVRARSTVANRTNERFWSEPAVVFVRSLPDRPCKEPEAFPGSFEVNSSGAKRNITLHWSQMKSSCENGHNPGYEVVMRRPHTNLTETKLIDGTETTWVDFGSLSVEEEYNFEMRSRNDFNYSFNSTHIRLPAVAAMPLRVENVIKIGYNDTLFEVQWIPSVTSPVTNYTIFWCHSVRETPVRCVGQLHAVDVGPELTAFNITVPDAKSNYQFGVGANGGGGAGASGIVWSSCIINANGPNSQIKNVDLSYVTSSTIGVSWSLPCTPQNGIITGFNIYYCKTDVNADCIDGSTSVKHIEAGQNSYSIEDLNPFTFYKISMSVQTIIGEGETSAALVNRTAAGKPSPVRNVVADSTNETVSVSWMAPLILNGDSIFYKIYLNDAKPVITDRTNVVLVVESYTDYSLLVQACNSIVVCSSNSPALTFRTKIGVPSEPRGAPTLQMKGDNQSLILVNWLEPEKPSGLVDHYVIHINTTNAEEELTVKGNATSWEIDSSSICLPDNQLNVKVRAVNRAENQLEMLPGPWSPEGFFPCPTSGLSVGYILLIAFGAALFVLVVAALSFFSRQVHIQREKARDLPVRMPWETISFKADSGDKLESIQNKIVNYRGNYYGLLKSKLSSNGAANGVANNVTVVPLSDQAGVVADGVNHQGSESGGNSRTCSISSQQASEVTSNADTGIVSETDLMNTVISGPFTDLAKSKEMMKEDIICSQFPVDNNMDTAHLSQIPESLAQTGMVDAIMAVSSKGYVTLGQAHSFPASPTSSPNLSTTSNDSLLSKSNRTPVRLNVSKSASQENLPISSPPGYVSFKSGEPVVCETTGYVTIGTVYPDTTNYVKMGVQTLEKSDSPVYI